MERELAVEEMGDVPVSLPSQEVRAEGNGDLCYQIQTPKVLPHQVINATSVYQLQSKG